MSNLTKISSNINFLSKDIWGVVFNILSIYMQKDIKIYRYYAFQGYISLRLSINVPSHEALLDLCRTSWIAEGSPACLTAAQNVCATCKHLKVGGFPVCVMLWECRQSKSPGVRALAGMPFIRRSGAKRTAQFR